MDITNIKKLVEDEKQWLIDVRSAISIKRESLEDLVRNDIYTEL